MDPRRVWILSGSRGSEADLLVAAHWPTLVRGVIATAPSSVVWGTAPGHCQPLGLTAWTLHGQPLNTDASSGRATGDPDGSISDRSAFLSGLSGPSATAARIPIERFKGPLMLISGGADDCRHAHRLRRPDHGRAARHSADHVHLNYPAAGHLVFGVPSTPAPVEGPVVGAYGRTYLLNLGGSEAADQAAYLSDWPAVISFILSH